MPNLKRLKLSKNVTFTIYHFDTSVDESSKYVWKKRQDFNNITRTRQGGTCFNSAEEHFEKISSDYDGYIVMTDGCAPKPKNCISKRCWVLLPGYKLIIYRSIHYIDDGWVDTIDNTDGIDLKYEHIGYVMGSVKLYYNNIEIYPTTSHVYDDLNVNVLVHSETENNGSQNRYRVKEFTRYGVPNVNYKETIEDAIKSISIKLCLESCSNIWSKNPMPEFIL